MLKILLVFPHQLFQKHPGLDQEPDKVVLIEDSLFFGDWHYPAKFHKQKLWLHRASMKRYAETLREAGYNVSYLDYDPKKQSLQTHLKKVCGKTKTQLIIGDPTDCMLQKRIDRFVTTHAKVELQVVDTDYFINRTAENVEYRAGKKRWFMADFYKWQRRRLDVLMDGDEPQGGQWSFDEANRKKVPKKMLSEIPNLPQLKHDEIDEAARQYVNEKFADNPGSLENLYYPTSHRGSANWLTKFLKQRFDQFGDYEDAIVEGESWLWHSVLTPMLNVGLLTPQQIIKAATKHAEKHDTPINSVEGFVRQIIGWREFMRACYLDLGVAMRTTNYWDHHNEIPASFYDGTTGILPIDDTIQRILKTGYCHHIERLMVLGGFMFLCEFHPDEIYRWFMEMFVDSYDWVMVPNAYAMSQNADGGLITTKPYFSGSSYVRKMSHYKPAPWCDTWDGLYWRWILNHSDALGKNPRWAMMCSMAKKMDPEKKQRHLQNAEQYLDQFSAVSV